VYFGGTSSASIIGDINAEINLYVALRVECTGCIVRRNLAVTTGGTTANGSTSSGLATDSLDRKGVARGEKAKAVVGE
jgi:hypothetical protein